MRALLLGLLLTSCAPPLVLEGAPCPCSSGWSCCENVSVCVREGQSCPIVPGPVVNPPNAELGQDRIQRFTTTATDVTWAIEEGATGGTIDQTGRYRAPNAVGQYHVLASARGGVTRVTVTVRPLRLSVLAGSSGGVSSVPVDGVGQLARLSKPADLARVGDSLYFIDNDALRRFDLATRRIDTLFGKSERNIPSHSSYPNRRQLSRSRADTLLFMEESCVRELSLARNTIDTFWCGEAVFAAAGDETRLVGFEYRSSKVFVMDRATRQSLDLPSPNDGWGTVKQLHLEGNDLWVLDHAGSSVHRFDLRQPTAPPTTILPTTAGKVFLHLEPVAPAAPGDLLTLAALEASGRLVRLNLQGQEVGFETAVGPALSFTATGTASSSYFTSFYLLTPDTIRRTAFGVQELLAGKPARDRIEVDGIGGGAGIVVWGAMTTRGDVTWLGSLRSVRRIARDGTTTSIPSEISADTIAVDDQHVYASGTFITATGETFPIRRVPLDGGAWETLPYQPDEPVQLLGPMADGRIAFVERGKVRFVDPTTGQLLPLTIALPRMSAISLDPAGGLFGEVSTFVSPPATTAIGGVQRLDFMTGRLEKKGPDPLFEKSTGSRSPNPITNLAAATNERQYARSSSGDQVFVDQAGVWVPLVGVAGVAAVREGPLPGGVNTITGISTLDNGDVVLVDKLEHVVLVVE